MSVELVSGPDLGGGYLHQLSRVRTAPAESLFTYHAQDGGADADGPPIGSLEPLGHFHPPEPCMFGGPRCWHRAFRVPDAETRAVRTAYNRFRFALATALAQRYRSAPFPFERTLAEVFGPLRAYATSGERPVYVRGDAALGLHGIERPAAMIELVVTRPIADELARTWREALIEPFAPRFTENGSTTIGGRAWIGPFTAGAIVDWAVPDTAGGSKRTGLPPEAIATVVRDGREWPVARLEVLYLEAFTARDAERERAIAERLRAVGAHRVLLESLARDRGLAPEEAERLLQRFD